MVLEPLPRPFRINQATGPRCPVENLILLLLITIVFISSPLAAVAPPGERIIQISVIGSNRYPEAEIIRATGLKLGSEVKPGAFQNAADNLAATGAFSDVNFKYASKPGGVAVELRVTDGGDFGACNFDNLVWFSEKELRAQIRELVPLFGEKIPLKGDIPAKIEAAIEYLLKAKGIPGKVTILGAGEIGGTVTALQFSVTGARLAVQQVEILGAQAVDAVALAGAIQPLLNTDYDQTFVREFVRRNVGPLYAQLGFLKVAVGPPSASLLPGSSQDLAVAIPIAEGDQFALGEIRWEGNQLIPSADLSKLVRVLPGQPADTIQLEKDLEEMEGLYASKGYITARLGFQPSFDEGAKTVAIVVQVREGDLYSMGKLEIAGIDESRAESLKKNCDLAPGQPYDRSYWSAFISKSGRLLPAHRAGWKAGAVEKVNADSKTVDVTLTFSPNTGQ